MSNTEFGYVPEKKPEQKLVELMASETGVEMSAKMMRLFIRSNWKRVSLYAHSIHDEANTQAEAE